MILYSTIAHLHTNKDSYIQTESERVGGRACVSAQYLCECKSFCGLVRLFPKLFALVGKYEAGCPSKMQSETVIIKISNNIGDRAHMQMKTKIERVADIITYLFSLTFYQNWIWILHTICLYGHFYCNCNDFVSYISFLLLLFAFVCDSWWFLNFLFTVKRNSTWFQMCLHWHWSVDPIPELKTTWICF